MLALPNIVSISLDSKTSTWLNDQKDKSKAIRNLIYDKIKNEGNVEVLRKLIKEKEKDRSEIETELNFFYTKLSTVLKKREEIETETVNKINQIIKSQKDAKKQKFLKIENSPIFKELMSRKNIDEKFLLKLVEKSRKMGNRDFGTYDLKEYVDEKAPDKV